MTQPQKKNLLKLENYDKESNEKKNKIVLVLLFREISKRKARLFILHCFQCSPIVLVFFSSNLFIYLNVHCARA